MGNARKFRRWLPDGDERESPAYALVRHVAKSVRHDSWRKINEALGDALALALKANLEFALRDFQRFQTSLNGPHWTGDLEHWYGLAVDSGNISACLSLEAYLERPPYIWQGKRLARGSLWKWPPHPVPLLVTSLSATNILGCTYKGKDGSEIPAGQASARFYALPSPGPDSRVKICRRFTIDRETFQSHPERTG